MTAFQLLFLFGDSKQLAGSRRGTTAAQVSLSTHRLEQLNKIILARLRWGRAEESRLCHSSRCRSSTRHQHSSHPHHLCSSLLPLCCQTLFGGSQSCVYTQGCWHCPVLLRRWAHLGQALPLAVFSVKSQLKCQRSSDHGNLRGKSQVPPRWF